MRTTTAIFIAVALCCAALTVQAKSHAKKTHAKLHGQEKQNAFKFLKEHSVNNVNEAEPVPESSETVAAEGTKIVIVNKVCGETTNVNKLSKPANSSEFSQLSDSAESAESENKIVIINKIGCAESAESAESGESEDDSTADCTVVCIADKGNQYRRNPADCNSYIQCSEGLPYVRSCAANLVWDETIDACNYSNAAPACEPLNCPTLTINYRVGDEWLSMVVNSAVRM